MSSKVFAIVEQKVVLLQQFFGLAELDDQFSQWVGQISLLLLDLGQ